MRCLSRAVAQFGSALDWGSRGRRFKSCQPDKETGCDLQEYTVYVMLKMLEFDLRLTETQRFQLNFLPIFRVRNAPKPGAYPEQYFPSPHSKSS